MKLTFSLAANLSCSIFVSVRRTVFTIMGQNGHSLICRAELIQAVGCF